MIDILLPGEFVRALGQPAISIGQKQRQRPAMSIRATEAKELVTIAALAAEVRHAFELVRVFVGGRGLLACAVGHAETGAGDDEVEVYAVRVLGKWRWYIGVAGLHGVL